MAKGLMQNGVKNVYNVCLKYHLIKMGIENGLNTIDHALTTSFNCHLELTW
jgi:hypothetical protein